MIKDDDDFDIYDITEDQYNDDIKDRLFNHWDSGYDIITEYFGNTSIFEPTLDAFTSMLNLIASERRNIFDMETNYKDFIRLNLHHTYCNVLRHYAYYYVQSFDFTNFKLKLKDYVEDKNE